VAKNNIPWFMNPKSPVYKAFIKNQKFGMSSSIKASKNALNSALYDPTKNPALLNAQSRASMDVNADPSVAGYNAALGGIQSNDAINKNYSDQLAKVSALIKGTNYGQGGANVSAATSAMGGAIGADATQTANLAQSAGTVSGMGGQGGDVYSNAILGGAASDFARLGAQDVKDQSATRMQLTLDRGGELSRLNQMKVAAGTEAAGLQTQMLEGRQGLLTGIAGLRDQQRAAYDPFKMAGNQQAYISGNINNAAAYAAYRKAGGKKSYKSFSTSGTGAPNGRNPAGPAI
jgi:hypothetical protein